MFLSAAYNSIIVVYVKAFCSNKIGILQQHNFVFPSITKIVFPSILIQLEIGPNEFHFKFNQPGCSRKEKTKKHY